MVSSLLGMGKSLRDSLAPHTPGEVVHPVPGGGPAPERNEVGALGHPIAGILAGPPAGPPHRGHVKPQACRFEPKRPSGRVRFPTAIGCGGAVTPTRRGEEGRTREEPGRGVSARLPAPKAREPEGNRRRRGHGPPAPLPRGTRRGDSATAPAERPRLWGPSPVIS